jgi:arylsulfatase A-like enzyme
MKNVLVVLTADHGVAPLPELMEKRKMPGGRVQEEKVIEAVNAALAARYGAGKWVLGNSGPAPYLDHNLIASKKLNLEEVQNTAAQAVRALPYIARVFTREDLRRGLAPADFIARRVTNGFFYHRASDLFVLAQPYWLFEDAGTSHGTPYNYDSHVPLIFMGPGIKPGLYHQRAAVNDLAATLATMLAVETPSGANGRVLAEMWSQ